MPFPDDFADEALYTPDQWYVHDVLELDVEAGRVVTRTDTTRLGPLVDAQRAWPGHERHLPGAVAIQITGTLGNLHATYCLGLRPTQGWVGFGTHIHLARFPSLGTIGPELRATAVASRVRRVRGTTFIRYTFTYEQEDRVVYESEQTAAWFQTEHRGPIPQPTP